MPQRETAVTSESGTCLLRLFGIVMVMMKQSFPILEEIPDDEDVEAEDE
jgi:hypothetical protein